MKTLPFFCALSFAALGCGDGTETEDAGVRIDAGSRIDAARADGGSPIDSGSPIDAGTDSGEIDAGSDAATEDDAGALVCAPGTSIPDGLGGVCDFRGQEQCRRWARDNSKPNATAVCLPPDGRCARADTCTAAGCTCGDGPECEDDATCVLVEISTYACVCLSDVP